MIRSLWLSSVLLVAGSASAATPDWVLEAIRAPAPPERKMSVLFRETQVQFLGPDRYHKRIRYAFRLVEGDDYFRKQAKFSVSYNADTDRITRASAWVSRGDGSSPKAYARSDFVDVGSTDHVVWTRERAILFDGSGLVPAHGTLVCEVESDQSSVFELGESFAPRIVTEREILEVAPPAGMQLTWHGTSSALPQPAPGATAGSLRWESGLMTVPAATTQPLGFLPNPRTIYVSVAPPGTPISWAGLSHTLSGIMEPSTAPSPAVTAKAQALAAAGKDRWSRIRALGEFVQQQIVYLSLMDDTDSWAGCRPHPAAEVLANRYGDCKDKAALLQTMLRAIGEDSRILLVNLGNPQAVSPDWPMIHFNHAILAIRAGDDAPADWPRIDGGPLGPLVVFDPTHPYCPLGVLTGPDQAGWALLIDPQNGALVHLPEDQGPMHAVETRAVARLDAAGELTVTLDSEMHGLPATEAYTFKAVSRKERMAQLLTAEVHQSVPSVQDLTWRDDWSPERADYHLHYEFKAQHYAQPLGPELIAFSPQVGTSLAALPDWRTSREGVSWLWTGAIRRHITIKIPDGYAVEELPDNWDRSGATVSSHLAYHAEGREVHYELEYSLQPGFYDRAHYEAIRKFMVKFEDAEKRPVLLRKTEPATKT